MSYLFIFLNLFIAFYFTGNILVKMVSYIKTGEGVSVSMHVLFAAAGYAAVIAFVYAGQPW